jgi:protein tyrosine/serine phosphatase
LTLADVDLSRVLDWEGCYNVRDLGGLTTGDGGRIRWGALIRSDIPTRLTEKGRKSLFQHGVRTLVDLRFKDEVASDWAAYPFQELDGPDVCYSHVPFDTGRDAQRREEESAAYDAARSRAEFNRLDLDWGRGGIAAAVAAIADAPEGGVLVHCHAGKDRTGIVTALVLSLLGVSDDDIADDYALTTLNLEPLIVEWLDGLTEDPDERDRLRTLATPAREAMLDTLAHLRRRYGSAAEYLQAAGLSDAQMERLRARLLEGA